MLVVTFKPVVKIPKLPASTEVMYGTDPCFAISGWVDWGTLFPGRCPGLSPLAVLRPTPVSLAHPFRLAPPPQRGAM